MYTKIILIIIFAIISKYIYSKYQNTEEIFESYEHYKLVSDYFIGDDMHKSKPILWIYTPTEINARNWNDFYSRNTLKLNQPYLQITMKSIFDKCKDSFNVCLINDDVFNRLLNWNIVIDDLSAPVKNHYRQLGMSMLLYEYGGIIVPPSFLCVKDLHDMYTSGLGKSTMFVVENINRTVTHDQEMYLPDVQMMGCRKKSLLMKKLVDFQESLFLDKTNQPDFIGNVSLWCKKQEITIIDGMYIGVKKVDNTPVNVSELLGNNPVTIADCTYGIYLPQEEILYRSKYSWFARMSTQQILKSDLTISKYMLASY
jgi:hypothetical protein